MPDSKKRYRWRAYLDDFQMDATGKYIYTGKHYSFVGDARERKVYFAKLIVCGAVALIATVAPECLPPTDISRTPVALLPWALQLIAVLVASWSLFRILTHATETREYVYKATVPTLPAKSMISAILAAVTTICQVVYLSVNGLTVDGYTAARLVGPPIAATAEVFLFFTARAGKWEVK